MEKVEKVYSTYIGYHDESSTYYYLSKEKAESKAAELKDEALKQGYKEKPKNAFWNNLKKKEFEVIVDEMTYDEFVAEAESIIDNAGEFIEKLLVDYVKNTSK